jgi:hypothetical protein
MAETATWSLPTAARDQEEARLSAPSENLRYVYPTHIAPVAAQRYHVHCAELSNSFFSMPLPPHPPPDLATGEGSTLTTANSQDARAFSQSRPACSPFDPLYARQTAGDDSCYLNELLSFASQLSPGNQALLFGSSAPLATGSGAMQSMGCAGGAADMAVSALLAPPERDALASMVSPEEVDIYRMSDSEDEVIEVPRRGASRMPGTTSSLLFSSLLFSSLLFSSLLSTSIT